MHKRVNHDHIYEKALNDLFEVVFPNQVRLIGHQLDYSSDSVSMNQNLLVA